MRKISVVMPAYNAEKYITVAIDSVLRQTYSNIELLVADDGSKDNTRRIIDSIKDLRIKRFHNPQNIGYLKTCNKLFDFTTGDFIAFQDADDYSDLTRLETQMKEFERDADLAVCGTNLTAISEDGIPMFCSYYFCDWESIKSCMLSGEYSMIPNSFVFKREILDTIGKYNEYWDRIGAEDYYWAWLIMEKYKLINIRPALYCYRYNPGSITGDWSDNRRKLHNQKLLQYLFKKRLETGSDPIKNKEWQTLDEFISLLDKPYLEDPSLYCRQMARRDFYSGNRKRALKLALKAVYNSPFRIENYRNFFYYFRNTTIGTTHKS